MVTDCYNLFKAGKILKMKLKVKHTEFAARLKEALKDAGYSKPRNKLGVEEMPLARHLKVSREIVHRYIEGKTKPYDDKLKKIALFLNVSYTWLRDGIGAKKFSPIVNITENASFVPLIDYKKAVNWKTEYKNEHQKLESMIACSVQVSEKAFALPVIGIAMQRDDGDSFPVGSYIIVDPDVKPADGSYVVARIGDSPEATFKQLRIDAGAGTKYLINLNKSFNTTLPLTASCEIIGVVVYMCKNIK